MLLKSSIKSRWFFLFGLSTITVGLSLSKPLISLGQIILFLAWLIEGNIKHRILLFYKNKIAIIISSIYLLTLLGLFYTSNFDYAIGDVRRKAALFFLPFLIAGFSPITKKEWKLIFKIYVLGVLISSFWSMFVFLGGLEITVIDVREYSRFNSHIRFGLEICFAIFGGIYFLIRSKNLREKFIWLMVIFWLIIFIYLVSLFTAALIFVITSFLMLLYYGVTYAKKGIRYSLLLSLMTLFFAVFFYVKEIFDNYKACEKTEQLLIKEQSSVGEFYYRNTTKIKKLEKENGYYVWQNIAWKELESGWNKKSKLPFDGLDLKKQLLSTTLIRFLTSKGLNKDLEGINQLSADEILAVEKGIANVKYLSMNNIEVRIHKIIWAFDNYQHGGDYNGHSVIMRWTYWKTAYHIFKKNVLIGVGTGDLQDAFNIQYEEDKTILQKKHRLRSHNQYITYAVTFGLLGLLSFLFFLFYPFIKEKGYKDVLYLMFFCIILLSMLTEDTLETQVGINFFALFNTIFLLKEKD